MKHHSIRKHLFALFSMALLIVCVLSVASASTLKSSLYFTKVETYSLKTSTFDLGAVTLKGKATKGTSSTAYWHMKFAGRSSGNLPTNNNTYNFRTTVVVSSNTYGAFNTYPDAGYITGSILCYQD